MVNKPTHQVTITLVSSEDDPNITMKVQWSPLLGDDEIERLGYVPAAYQIADRFIDAAQMMIDTAQLLELEPGDMDASRSIN